MAYSAILSSLCNEEKSFLSLEGAIDGSDNESVQFLGKNGKKKRLFVDSFVALCATFGVNYRQLFLWLDSNKSASFILYEELLDVLHPSILQYLFQHSSVISVVQETFKDSQRFILQLQHLKTNGKLSMETFEVCRLHPQDIQLQKILMATSQHAPPPPPNNPFDDLKFSVVLTESQKHSKDALSLPHWSARKDAAAGGSQQAVISYFHAKEDDFDEEDPDADLEF